MPEKEDTMGKPSLANTMGVILFCAGTIMAQAQTFSTVALFQYSNGSNPFAPVVQGTDGNFYGTTYTGWRFESA